MKYVFLGFSLLLLFIGSMHHFRLKEKIDLSCNKVLKQNGLLMCHEPVRDCVTKRNAILNLLITTLLAASGSYFKSLEKEYEKCIPKNIERIFNKLKYELEDGEKVQSVNDNEIGFSEMYPMLKKKYTEIDFQWRYGLFHEIIGGIRLATEDDEANLAKFIRDIDQVMCRENIVDPTEFFFVGKKK